MTFACDPLADLTHRDQMQKRDRLTIFAAPAGQGRIGHWYSRQQPPGAENRAEGVLMPIYTVTHANRALKVPVGTRITFAR